MRLLLSYAHDHTRKAPHELDFDDLNAPLIGAFLSHLETVRGNSVRTRNNRLAAIHSLYRYAALRHPEHAQTIARVIAIPTKRHRHEDISYLDVTEIKALLAAPDKSRWLGRRDHALLLTMIQTGVRVAELTALCLRDVNLAASAAGHIRVVGKGRKRRAVTLTHETAAVLRGWLAERQGQANDPLFPTRHGGTLSREPSLGSSPSTRPPRRRVVRRFRSSESLRTCCGTPTRCCSRRTVSRLPRSRSGSATRASRPYAQTVTFALLLAAAAARSTVSLVGPAPPFSSAKRWVTRSPRSRARLDRSCAARAAPRTRSARSRTSSARPSEFAGS
jgi:integrase